MAGLHHAIVADNCKTGKSNGLTRNNPRPYGGLLAKVLILRSSARQHIHVLNGCKVVYNQIRREYKLHSCIPLLPPLLLLLHSLFGQCGGGSPQARISYGFHKFIKSLSILASS